MIFLLLYGLGLRVGEVSRLHRDDVDLDAVFFSSTKQSSESPDGSHLGRT